MANYTQAQLDLIWWQTTRPLGLEFVLTGQHPTDARMDEEGRIIYRSRYGMASLAHSWEVDHRHASALGGSNSLINLRALSCESNRRHGGLLGNVLNALDSRR